MSAERLNSMTCGAQGNVVSWTGTDSKWGTLREKQDYVPACSGKVCQIKSYGLLKIFKFLCGFYKNHISSLQFS